MDQNENNMKNPTKCCHTLTRVYLPIDFNYELTNNNLINCHAIKSMFETKLDTRLS